MFDDKNVLDDDLALDLTPLIDVIFMLLVFFIMTTTFSKPVMDLVLPEAEMTEDAKKEEEIVISITKEGAYFYKDTQISLASLTSLFEEHKLSTINFFVDKDAPFEAFIQAIDRAKARDKDLAEGEKGGKFVISTEAAQ